MSEDQGHEPGGRHLIEAYNRMMERVRGAIAAAERQAGPRLRRAVEEAKEKAVELGELTREEAERIAAYLLRDVQDAADYLAGPKGEELKQWLRFDIELIEQRLFELFLGVADQAKVEMVEFQQELAAAGSYRTGEITGPGTLACTACGELLHFHHTGHIPPCPRCHKTLFSRPD